MLVFVFKNQRAYPDLPYQCAECDIRLESLAAVQYAIPIPNTAPDFTDQIFLEHTLKGNIILPKIIRKVLGVPILTSFVHLVEPAMGFSRGFKT